MQIGDPIEVTVEKMAAGGEALGRAADGRVVFVDGVLPGEVVRAEITKTSKDYVRAARREVLVTAPERVVPPCPEMARGCGGCDWQFVDPAAQLGLKTAVVADALRRTARLADADVRAGAAVPPWGYRTTMRLAVAAGGRLGLRASSTHDVVALDSCPVAHPALSSRLGSVRATGATEVSLRVSVATGAMTAFADAPSADIDGLPTAAGVGPAATIDEVVDGQTLRVSAASFFQSGPAAAGLLVAAVGEACGTIDGRTRFLDAYGGIGLFAATVGRTSEALVVESSAAACDDARHNVGGRARVIRSAVERWRPQPCDVVVADPARAGLQKGGVHAIAATGAARVVLVSCDPVAMARDTRLLIEGGYRHRTSVVLDLFPNTSHVEVVTTFDRSR